MTTANMKLVVLEVDVPSLNPQDLPTQKLEEGEHIVRRIVALDRLNEELEGSVYTTFLFQQYYTSPFVNSFMTSFTSICGKRIHCRCSFIAFCHWVAIFATIPLIELHL
jgi:hypothetical protein